MHFLRRNFRQNSKSNLSLPQVRVLAFLNRSPGASLTMVSDWLGVTNATASNIVERLVQLKLVKRIDDPEERRRITLNLTTQGEQNLLAARELAIEHMTSLLSKISESELTKLHDSLGILKEVFGNGH